MTRRFLSTLAALVVLVPAAAHAQNREVLQRLQQFGRMPRNDARALVRTIDDVLAANARRGGTDYDRPRQAVGTMLFGANGAGYAGSTIASSST